MTTKRALVVEDHADTLFALQFFMKEYGYEVCQALTLRQAFDCIDGTPDGFDILIADVSLTDGSGLDVMKRMGESVCGIALTGHDGIEVTRMISKAGFRTHLVKPIDFDRLEAEIDKAIEACSQ